MIAYKARSECPGVIIEDRPEMTKWEAPSGGGDGYRGAIPGSPSNKAQTPRVLRGEKDLKSGLRNNFSGFMRPTLE